MYRLLVFLLFVSHVLSDSCVTYDFEEGYPDLFNNESGFCSTTMPFWNLNKYEDTLLTGHNAQSTKFISPLPESTCVSSFLFPMNRGGIVEVNMYMDTTSAGDIIEVMVMERDVNGFDFIVATAYNSPFGSDIFVSGWHALKVPVGGSASFEGYITLRGWKDSPGVVLVDSFRYIPPDTDASECEIYPEITTESTPEIESITEIITETAAPETAITTVSPDVTPDSTETEPPTTLPDFDDIEESFWTPLRLGLLALVLVLIVLVLCSFCFICCRPRTKVIVVKA